MSHPHRFEMKLHQTVFELRIHKNIYMANKYEMDLKYCYRNILEP